MSYFIWALSTAQYPWTDAEGLNDRGEVAGAATVASHSDVEQAKLVGVIWSSGGWDPSFAMDDGTRSRLVRINDSGAAVGTQHIYAAVGQPEEAILVKRGVFTNLSHYVGESSRATDINNGGLICGVRSDGLSSFVLNWWNKTITEIPPLPLPGASQVRAHAINQWGEVVGLSGDLSGDLSGAHGFIYSGALTDLGPAVEVNDINDVGYACGAISGTESQLWLPAICDLSQSAPAFAPIPLPEGFAGGTARGINNNGEVVGSCWTAHTASDQSDRVYAAYVYSGGTSTDLNRLLDQSGTGWRLLGASGINESGQIAGGGTWSGEPRGFLLTPSPTPLPNPQYKPGPGYSAELVASLVFGGAPLEDVILRRGGAVAPSGAWERAWASLPAVKRDALIGLALDELAQRLEDADARKAIRRPILDVVRRQVERMLKAPLAEVARPDAEARRTPSSKLPGPFARWGRRRQQQP